MKRLSTLSRGVLIAGLFVFVAMGASSALADEKAHEHHDMNMNMKGDDSRKEVTMVGEVLDLYCYMQHPADGQGMEHANCAKNCIRKGLPIGFLSDGKVYLIIGKGHESAKDLVVDYAGTQSKLTGTLIDHDGVKAIELSKIEKVNG